MKLMWNRNRHEHRYMRDSTWKAAPGCRFAYPGYACWIRIDRIVTLNAALIVKTIGQASDRVLENAVEQFCKTIGSKPKAQAQPDTRTCMLFLSSALYSLLRPVDCIIVK
jgi:hypothetical protein